MVEERLSESVKPSNHHMIEAYSKRGFLKWAETIPNLVTKEGAIWLLDQSFGIPLPQAWHCGLTRSGGISSNDTMSSHGWVEFVGTTHERRPLLEFKPHDPKTAPQTYTTTKSAQFVIHEAGPIDGSFMVSDDEIGGNKGLLYGITKFNNTHNVVQGDSVYITIILGSQV